MSLSKKSWIGVAREATSGTAITTPTLYIPCKSNIKAMKKREYLQEERGDRNEEYDVVDTIRFADWDAKGPFYPDSDVYFLLGAIGSNSSAQPNSGTAPTVWKHTLTLADTPPSLTLMKSFDAKTYYMPYSVVEKFSFKFTTDKLLEFDASGKGIFPSIQASPPTPSFTAVKPFAGYAPTITLTGGASTDIDELEITFEQKITLWNPANGSQDWVTAYFGARKVGLSFTARFDADSLYQTYFRAPNVYDTLTFDVQGANIASTYNYELNIQIPVTTYDTMEHDLGKDNVLIKAKGRGVATGAGAGNNLIKLWVQNTVSNSYTA